MGTPPVLKVTTSPSGGVPNVEDTVPVRVTVCPTKMDAAELLS
jgi:hypothetical protein